MTPHELVFVIVDADGRRRVTLNAERPLWIGRDPECDIPLGTQSISRRHVSVQRVADGIQITDGSTNGTWVEELHLKRAARTYAAPKVRLRVGTVDIRVSLPVEQPAREDQQPVPEPASDSASQQAEEAPERAPQQSEQRSARPEAGAAVATRRELHGKLLENLELPNLDRRSMDAEVMRPKVIEALRRIVAEAGADVAGGHEPESLVLELADEALGLGPLERLLADPDVNEIMVVDPHTIFVERLGKMELTGLRFTDDDSVRAVIERIVTPLGRRIDESTPLVDARLKDGSRVNAVIPPLALRGPCITIRKFAKDPLGMADLVRFGSVSEQMGSFLERSVRVRKNIVISGGTGSGKTTLLNVLSAAIPSHERVVTVEDAAELQLSQPHVVGLEARPPNLEGKGEYSIRDLVKNALRMRPDRIVVGECRGGEAIDMLQAMNTGHEGSLTTTHANSPREAVARIETLCLMAGLDLPVRAIRQQIATSVHLIVQQTRYSDGSRRVSNIAEVVGIDDEGEVELQEIFSFDVSKAGLRVEGEFVASGYLPSFVEQFVAHGLLVEGGAL
jgi:pilus assembly protein CpaF